MNEPDVGPLSDAQIKALGDNPALMHVIANLLRPGVADMLVRLEEAFFMPPHGDNAKYLLGLVAEFAGAPWAVASVPIEFEGRVVSLLSQHGWRLADGIPHLLVKGRVAAIASFRTMPATRRDFRIEKAFVLNSPRAYTLEVAHATPGPHTAGVMVSGSWVDATQN